MSDDMKIQDIFPKGKTLFFELKINTDDTKQLHKLYKLIFKEEGLPEGISCDKFWFPNVGIDELKKSLKSSIFNDTIDDIKAKLNELEMLSYEYNK
jgi:hypothetical protein